MGKKYDPVRRTFENAIAGLEKVLVDTIDSGQIKNVKKVRDKNSCTITPNSTADSGYDAVDGFEYFFYYSTDPKDAEKGVTVSGPWDGDGNLKVGLSFKEDVHISEDDIQGIFSRLDVTDRLIQNYLWVHCNGEKKKGERFTYLIPISPKK